MNFQPIEEVSNNNNGIFVVDHAPIKIRTLENLLPFFNRTPATGKAAYNGPAAADPKKNAIAIPISPDFSPISLIIVLRSTQTSNNPRSMNIGGITESISSTFDQVMLRDFCPIVGYRIIIPILIATRIIKNLYLLIIFFILIPPRLRLLQYKKIQMPGHFLR